MTIDLKDLVNPLSALKHLGKKPHTIRLPYEKKEPADRVRGFHENDWSLCVGCGNCARICNVQAIEMVEIEGLQPRFGSTNLRPKVDYGRCCFCAQCVDVCPTGSLKLTDHFTLVTPDKEDFVFIPDVKKYPHTGKGWTTTPETSLLRYDRVEMPEKAPEERKRTFDHVLLGFTEEMAVTEANRCLGCAICMQGCPTEMYIPHYLEEIANKEYDKAVNTFFINNPLPEICGTVCTHRCENACVLGNRGKPIQIRFEKGFAAGQIDDYGKVLKNLKKAPPTGKKVAIIGAGPGGLTVAFYLSLRGHSITIFEALSVPGGMMKVGIPRYRLPQNILDKEINFILNQENVEIKYNTRVGKDISFDELLEKFDAVYIGVGYNKGTKMGIPGEDAEGVIEAIDFLRAVNLGNPPKIGKKIVVVGGGDVAMDASRTPFRLGAEKVYISYRRRIVDMPASDEEKHEAMDEGVIFMPQTLPIEVVTKNGRMVGIKYVKTEMVDQGLGKRPKPVPKMDEVFFLEADNLILAIGQKPDLSFLPDSWLEKLELDKWGDHIIVDDHQMTSIPGVFAGGDIVNPRADIISAIADGRHAADGIDIYLRKK